MTIKQKIIELSDQLLIYLLEYKESHPGFRFWMRSREHNKAGDQERLNKGQWFQGSDYIFLSFYSASGHVNMTRSIGWVVEFDKNLKPNFHISIVWPTEKDKQKIELYRDMINKLGGFEKLTDTKFRKSLPDDDVFISLEKFLHTTYPQINDIIRQYGLTEVFTIPEEKFQKQLGRVLYHREQLQNKETTVINSLVNNEKSVQMDKINAPLNLILYGPPGTGKTYRMLSLCDNFILTKAVQTREQYLEELISELTWWETIAASMMVLKKTTVPELEKHEFLKIKSRQSGTKNIKQIIWGSLQTHTDPKFENVLVARRIEPFLFKKEVNSVWTILEESVTNEAPEIITFLNAVKEFKPDSGSIQKNFRMVTFHQSFAYEDFVEGIKPVFNKVTTDELEYEIQKGVFFQACNEAAKLAGYDTLFDCINDAEENRKKKIETAPPYALFIDEVNRANVSAVFGELITLIEDDKRLGKENEITDVVLPYSKAKFGIPGNLFIIGTMNTADRSVEALDTALRRRFAFEEMEAKEEILSPYHLLQRLWLKHWMANENTQEWKNWEIEEKQFIEMAGMIKEPAKYKALSDSYEKEEGRPERDDEWMAKDPVKLFSGTVTFKDGLDLSKLLKAVNSRLRALLTKDQTIGHAWLMNVYSVEDLQAAFKNKVLPLLQELFYNDYAKIGIVLGKNFVESQTIGQNLFAEFDDGNELASEYADKVIYKLKDPLKVGLKDFKSIYE